MSTLAFYIPPIALALIGDPLQNAALNGSLAAAGTVREAAAASGRALVDGTAVDPSSRLGTWATYLSVPGALPAEWTRVTQDLPPRIAGIGRASNRAKIRTARPPILKAAPRQASTSTLFEVAAADIGVQAKTASSEFAAHWIHPRAHKIERRLLDHPLSRDVPDQENACRAGDIPTDSGPGPAGRLARADQGGREIKPLNLRP